MKKLLFILLFAVSFSGVSQIKKVTPIHLETIGRIGPKNNPHILIEKKDSTYIFTYSDLKFTHIDDFKSFQFDDLNNDFEALYTMMLSGLENPPEEDVMIELPGSFIWLNYTKAMGVANVRIIHKNKGTGIEGYTVWLTKRRLNKLFGKKD